MKILPKLVSKGAERGRNNRMPVGIQKCLKGITGLEFADISYK